MSQKHIVPLIMLFVIGNLTLAVLGWTAPTTTPPTPDPGYPAGTTSKVNANCKCREATVLTRTADWSQVAKDQDDLWTWWKNGAAGWVRLGNATTTYNCFSLAFNGGNGWLEDPSPFMGDTTGCWKEDPNGTVRKSAEHACLASYEGKCGRMFRQNKNDDVYGAINTLYKQVP